jgi:CspA family cold shock protein
MSLNNVAVTTTLVTNTSERLIGSVKWFNNKSGYGFITVVDGENSGKDIFVHHTTINVSNQQYKYLVQGEYVEFSIVKVENSTHEYQAAQVSGIRGGKLMCETRRELKMARVNNDRSGDEIVVERRDDVRMPRQQRVQTKEQTPVVAETKTETESSAWSVVPNRSQSKPSSGRGRGRPPRSKEN